MFIIFLLLDFAMKKKSSNLARFFKAFFLQKCLHVELKRRRWPKIEF